MKLSKINITYIIAIFGSLIPAWIGSALLQQMEPNEPIFETSRGIITLCLFALSFWGTSFAFFYLGKLKYGILSGLGKWLLLFLGVWIYNSSNDATEGQHPYIIFLGILFAFLWGVMDLGVLYPLAKKRNLEH